MSLPPASHIYDIKDRKGGHSGSNECSFRFPVERKGQTKAFSDMSSWVTKEYAPCPCQPPLLFRKSEKKFNRVLMSVSFASVCRRFHTTTSVIELLMEVPETQRKAFSKMCSWVTKGLRIWPLSSPSASHINHLLKEEWKSVGLQCVFLYVARTEEASDYY